MRRERIREGEELLGRLEAEAPQGLQELREVVSEGVQACAADVERFQIELRRLLSLEAR